MFRCRAVVSLLVVIVSAACDLAPSAATGPNAAFQAQRSATSRAIPFKTSSYAFHGVAAVVEPGCNGPGESRRYLTGEGSATHLGSYTVGLNFCARAGGTLEDGVGTFVAANGDLLQFTFEGTSAFEPPFTLRFTSYAVFTGGTGRFDGASGEAEVTGSLDVRTGAGDGRWEGTISSVGSNMR
jgi:hypothetical protein